MAFGNDWTPDFSGYRSPSRGGLEAYKWKGGLPERIWREQGPDAWRDWLVKGKDSAYRNQYDKNYLGNPASWFESRLNTFDFWRAEQNRQPVYPD